MTLQGTLCLAEIKKAIICTHNIMYNSRFRQLNEITHIDTTYLKQTISQGNPLANIFTLLLFVVAFA